MAAGTTHFLIDLLALLNGFRSGGRSGTGINRFFGFLSFEPVRKTFDVFHHRLGLFVGQSRFPGWHGSSLDAFADGSENIGVKRERAGRSGPVFENAFAKIARPGIQIIYGFATAVAVLAMAERAHVFVDRCADGFAGLLPVAFMAPVVVGVGVRSAGIRSCQPKNQYRCQKTRQNNASNGLEFEVSIRCIRFHYHSSRLRRYRSRYSCNYAGSRPPNSKTEGTSM